MEKYLITRTSSTESLSAKRTRDDTHSNTWNKPKRIAHRRMPTANQNIPLSNRYKNLADDVEDDSSVDTPAPPTTTKRARSNKVPPIFIELKEDWTHQSVVSMISTHAKRFHLQYRGNGKVAIICYTNEDHQLIKVGLTKENVSFHTYTRKEEKMAKVVIHGLPATIIDSVGEELNSLGFPNAVVTKLKRASGEESLFPPILIQLPPGTDIVKFRQVKYLCNCSIQMQKYKSNNTSGTQCYRCQRFGHASRNCNLPERCVKCIEPHATKDCPKKDRTTTALCCNCNEPHPANYRQCKERLKYVQQIDTKKALQHKTARKSVIRPEDGRSWADITSGKKPVKYIKPSAKTNVRIDTHHRPDQQEPEDPVISEMLQILSIIKLVKREFSSCETMLDKVTLIVSHLGKYV